MANLPDAREVPLALNQRKAVVVKELRGLASMEQAKEVVELFGSSRFLTPMHGVVESLAAVWISQQGRWGSDVEAGVRLDWRQADSQYALLMPMSRLLKQAGDLEGAADYLRLAVDEPHGPTLDGGVLWFEDLPTGPY